MYSALKERSRLLKRQKNLCPVCLDRKELLVDDGQLTHLAHKTTVKEFASKVLTGELSFDDALAQLWDDSNRHAVHRTCDYGRNRRSDSGRSSAGRA